MANPSLYAWVCAVDGELSLTNKKWKEEEKKRDVDKIKNVMVCGDGEELSICTVHCVYGNIRSRSKQTVLIRNSRGGNFSLN